MTKRTISFLLVLALSTLLLPALATDSSMTVDDLNQATDIVTGTSQSPSISMTLNNLSQVTGTVTNNSISPSISMTLNNLNQVSGTTSGGTFSPSVSMTLNNLTQVSQTETGAVISPSLSMALYNLNRYAALNASGVSLSGLFTIKDTLSDDARAALEAIAAYVEDGEAAFGYFNTDIMTLILNGNLSISYYGFDFSSLILSEYVSLGINDYQADSAGVTTTFGFASEYQDGQTVVAMFGFKDPSGNILWTALNTVASGGQVTIDIPSDLLLMAGSEAILGILS